MTRVAIILALLLTACSGEQVEDPAGTSAGGDVAGYAGAPAVQSATDAKLISDPTRAASGYAGSPAQTGAAGSEGGSAGDPAEPTTACKLCNGAIMCLPVGTACPAASNGAAGSTASGTGGTGGKGAAGTSGTAGSAGTAGAPASAHQFRCQSPVGQVASCDTLASQSWLQISNMFWIMTVGNGGAGYNCNTFLADPNEPSCPAGAECNVVMINGSSQTWKCL